MRDQPSTPPPPERHATERQALLACLDATPRTARDLSSCAGLSEKQVIQNLEHLQRSRADLLVEPAACLGCGFRFEKRSRLAKPGRCPLCRGTHIEPPRFSRSDPNPPRR